MEQEKKCTRCGICRAYCPVFKATLNEVLSTRGKAILAEKGINDENIYKCTICGACKKNCPAGFDIKIVAKRQELVKKAETKANKKMIANVRKHGNPFGELKDGEKPKDLYCC